MKSQYESYPLIRVNKTLKNALDAIIKQFKEKTGQRTTYENVILRLIARDEYLMKFGIDSGVKEILGISEQEEQVQ